VDDSVLHSLKLALVRYSRRPSFGAHRVNSDSALTIAIFVVSSTHHLSRKVPLTAASSLKSYIFNALHGMQMRSSDEKAVCLSACLSNARIVTKYKKNLSRFLYRTKDHLA